MDIIVCGDVSVTDYTYSRFKAGDAEGTFGDVLDLFRQGDRVLVNLECALTESEIGITKMGPCLKGPLETALTLKRAGVTDCMLSNNHIFDYGVRGLRDTLNALEEQGLPYTGIGENYQDSRKNYFIKQDGLTVAVVDVSEHEYAYALENRIGARPFDEFETMADIRDAKANADYVIVIYHGGKEHCPYPSPRLRKAFQEMVRCGADAVFGQHSHCISCYEQFEGGHLLYGQGNFNFVKYFDRPAWNVGLAVKLSIDKGGIGIDFIPVVANEAGDGIVLAKGDKKEEILAGFAARNEKLKNGQWRQEWHDFCESIRAHYTNVMCGPTLEGEPYALQFFSHFLDCEAHTDVWREIFPTWNHTNEL